MPRWIVLLLASSLSAEFTFVQTAVGRSKRTCISLNWFIFGFVLEYLYTRLVALTPYIVAVFHL
jgi:hypothetical protein